MRYKLHALAFLVIGLIFLVQTAEGAIHISVIDLKVYHAPSSDLDINASIIYDEFIPQDSRLRVYIDNSLQSNIDLQSYLLPENQYSYKSHTFSYNITTSGHNTWEQYPDVDFSCTVRVFGRNGTDCDNYTTTTRWPTTGYIGQFFPGGHVLDAQDILKQVREMPVPPIPNICPEYTEWLIEDVSSNESSADIKTSMREECEGSYDGFPMDDNGWIFRIIDGSADCEGIQATFDKSCTIHLFDNESLNDGFRAYGGPTGFASGGLYKDDVYQKWGNLNEVKWDGKRGYLRINNYDPGATYMLIYLPGNGPKVCAYTNYHTQSSSSWSHEISIEDVNSEYQNPYTRLWTKDNLTQAHGYGIPDCPCSDCNCLKNFDPSTVEETEDTDDAITIASSYDDINEILTVNGVCTVRDFTRNYTALISLEDGISSPSDPGSHDLELSLVSGTEIIKTKTHQFQTCNDTDGDGYCIQNGDCNDTNPDIIPGSAELCDGIDNNCDGNVDEDFYGEEFDCTLGQACNDWEGSICNGTCMCTPDKLNVTCNATYYPGEIDEICTNNLDDDCDGVIDEFVEIVNGSEVEGCIRRCTEGSKIKCSSDIGFCTPGERTCVNGTFGACIGFRSPREETCNMALNALPRYADDNCDGIIDNVYGGTSIEETKCGCYNGDPPSIESCNGIDDDCDNEIDERACSCSTGETRICGKDVGICKPGIQYCTGGYWETSCTGAVEPNPDGEICYDKLDNDCDGRTDEECNPGLTCENGHWDLNEEGVDCGGECPNPCEFPLPWIIISIVAIGFIGLFIFLEVKGKIPA